MEVKHFINNIRQAFGPKVQLPFAFWYADKPVNEELHKINGCFFKAFNKLMAGTPISLTVDRIGCMGGKLYTGFAPMNERIPQFVSLKEKYKQTPEMVIDFVEKSDIQPAAHTYLNIAPIDCIDRFDHVLGIFFLATPDVLSGLAAWTYFDNNADDAVTAKFGSGCSSIFTEAITENLKNGKRTFIGLFDPSVRQHLNENLLSFTIPMSRLKEMYETLPQCCLMDTHAWGRIRERMA